MRVILKHPPPSSWIGSFRRTNNHRGGVGRGGLVLAERPLTMGGVLVSVGQETSEQGGGVTSQRRASPTLATPSPPMEVSRPSGRRSIEIPRISVGEASAASVLCRRPRVGLVSSRPCGCATICIAPTLQLDPLAGPQNRRCNLRTAIILNRLTFSPPHHHSRPLVEQSTQAEVVGGPRPTSTTHQQDLIRTKPARVAHTREWRI